MNRVALFICELTVRIAALFAVAVGCAGLSGWILDLNLLKAFSPTGVTIKANAAIGLILAGSALHLTRRESASGLRAAVARCLALAAALIGGLSFAEHLCACDFGIDQLLFTEPPGALATTSPGRMGPPASLSLLLGGTAIAILGARRERPVVTAQTFSLAICVITLVPLIGYAYGITPLYGISRYTGIALHTALALFGLGAGILATRPNVGVMRTITADDAGGLLARRLLLPAILLPLFLGWIRTIGARAGLIDDAFGRPFLVLSFIISFTALGWWNARTVSALSRARDEVDAQLRDALRDAQLARADAERASRLKDEFLATLSHELRTPLNAILGWAQMLRSAALAPVDQAKGLDTIERNARAQAKLIEDLLDMSRIVSGKLRLEPQRVALETVVEAAIETLVPAAEAKGIRLEKSLDVVAGPVTGDAARLQQVVWNLLSNAIKFTPPGGQVSIKLRRGPSHVAITVADTGEGLAPHTLPFVFDRFWQADGSITRRHGGLGIGLGIVKQLVELHGGYATAHSDGLGRGATFTVHLPLAHVSTHDLNTRRSAIPSDTTTAASVDGDGDEAKPHALSPAVDLSGLRVLVVDDEPDACDLVRRLLAAAGAEVTMAHSVIDGLERLALHPPDLLLSDIGMPGIDGYEFIRRVRASQNPRLRGLPAIALTAFARSEDRASTLLAGFIAHVVKPIEPSELLITVAAIARRSGPIKATETPQAASPIAGDTDRRFDLPTR